jgi:ketosteroid isomerase-like protein
MTRKIEIVACIAMLAGGCAARGDSSADDTQARRDVLARLDGYVAASRAVDADASAAYFTASGTLFEPGIRPIVSPDSIRAFIKSFPGVEVHSAIATADTVEVYGNMALVWGSFFERLRFPGQPESAQHGRFVMQWRRESDGQWRIERYYRVPLPPS